MDKNIYSHCKRCVDAKREAVATKERYSASRSRSVSDRRRVAIRLRLGLLRFARGGHCVINSVPLLTIA